MSRNAQVSPFGETVARAPAGARGMDRKIAPRALRRSATPRCALVAARSHRSRIVRLEVTARLAASPLFNGNRRARASPAGAGTRRLRRLDFVSPPTSACYAGLGIETLAPSALAAARSQRDRAGLAQASLALVRRIASQFDDGCVAKLRFATSHRAKLDARGCVSQLALANG